MVGAGYKKNVLSFSAEFIDTGINGRDILIGSPQCFQVLGRTQWAMVLRRVGMPQPEERLAYDIVSVKQAVGLVPALRPTLLNIPQGF